MPTSPVALSGHRTIIVPEGVLDGDRINVIYIPTALQNLSTPLYVKKTKKMLTAYSLPLWDDELSSYGSSRQSCLVASRNILCPSEEAVDDYYDSMEAAPPSEPSKRTVGTGSYVAIQNQTRPRVAFRSLCAPTNLFDATRPKLYHASGKKVIRTTGRPTVSRTISIDSQRGIEPEILEQVNYDAFDPTYYSTPQAAPTPPARDATYYAEGDYDQEEDTDDSSGYFEPDFPSHMYIDTTENMRLGPCGGRFNIVSEMTPSPPRTSARAAGYTQNIDSEECPGACSLSTTADSSYMTARSQSSGGSSYATAHSGRSTPSKSLGHAPFSMRDYEYSRANATYGSGGPSYSGSRSASTRYKPSQSLPSGGRKCVASCGRANRTI